MAEPVTIKAILKLCTTNIAIYKKHKFISDIKNVKLDTHCIMKRTGFSYGNLYGKLMRLACYK